MRRNILIIKDPEVAKLFADNTRRQILHNLRHHEHSTTDLAKALNKSHSSIAHHLKLLKDAGLVDETKIEKKRNLVQTYYLTSAKRFIISYSLSDSLEAPEILTWRDEIQGKVITELNAFGIEVQDFDKNRIQKLLKACSLKQQEAFEEIIEKQIRPIELEKPVYKEIIRLLVQVRLAQDEEYTKMIHELGKLFEISSQK